jgi:hypothetical protein
MEFPSKLSKRHKVALFLTLLAAGTSLVFGVAAKQTAGIVLLGVAFAWALGSNSRVVHVAFIIGGLLLAIGPVLKDWYVQRSEMKEYRESVADFERRIHDLPKLPKPNAEISHRLAEQQPKRSNSDSDFQYIFLPDGRYGKFRADATDEQIVSKIEELFPGTFNDRKPTDSLFRFVALPDGNYLKAPPTMLDEKLRAEVAKNFPVLPRWEIDARLAGVDLDGVLSSELPRLEPDPYSLKLSMVTNWMFGLPGGLLSVIGISLLLWVKPETRIDSKVICQT